MTIFRVLVERRTVIMERTTIDVSADAEGYAIPIAEQRSGDDDVKWEFHHRKVTGLPNVIKIETLAEGDEEI